MANSYDKKIPASVEYAGYYTDDISIVIYSKERTIFDLFDNSHIICLIDSNNKVLCEYPIEKNRYCIGVDIQDNTIVYVCINYCNDKPTLIINFYSIDKSNEIFKIVQLKSLYTDLNNSCGNCSGSFSKTGLGYYNVLWGDLTNNDWVHLVFFNSSGFINQLTYKLEDESDKIVEKIDLLDSDELELTDYYVLNKNKFIYARAMASNLTDSKINLAIFDREGKIIFGQNNIDIKITHGQDTYKEFEAEINDFVFKNNSIYLLVSAFIDVKINVLKVKTHRFDFICDIKNNQVIQMEFVTTHTNIKPSIITIQNQFKIFNKTDFIL